VKINCFSEKKGNLFPFLISKRKDYRVRCRHLHPQHLKETAGNTAINYSEHQAFTGLNMPFLVIRVRTIWIPLVFLVNNN